MSGEPGLLAIDQGTTSTRAIMFAPDGAVIASAQEEFAQAYPKPGWVEHDPEVLWATALGTSRRALAAAKAKGVSAAAIGVTNQRETTIVWDRKTGAPIHNAIVWQDRRTADACRKLAEAGHEALVAERAGLVLDPYFSATKLAWILDHVPGARERAKRGELLFGTVDSWLIWRLTGGRVHATDATNASRTSLYGLQKGGWDNDLLALFGAPKEVLPEVRDSAGDFGVTDESVFGAAIPITGVAGDQQAAAIGQACFAPGEGKCTYGTGAFLLVNTGQTIVRSQARLLATVAWRLKGRDAFALEGSILAAGATVQWLRDGLGVIGRASDIEALAASVADSGGVYLVPAFAGLGAPWWDAEARGALVGLTRGTGRAEIARAALEAAAHQTADLAEAIAADGFALKRLKVDGGMAANTLFLQMLADLLGVEAVRPANAESTAWGAACLAGLGAGVFSSLDEIRDGWKADRAFAPAMDAARRAAARSGWRDAVSRAATQAR
ncbi:MAG: glycerol kinase GlpK [Maricaulaceae bacterium]|nr:glycerol kinase GlpK [Maricaulaceae bacterium]